MYKGFVQLWAQGGLMNSFKSFPYVNNMVNIYVLCIIDATTE